jgi:hypothetical protein
MTLAMNVHLMHHDRDFGPDRELPSNSESLTADGVRGSSPRVGLPSVDALEQFSGRGESQTLGKDHERLQAG